MKLRAKPFAPLLSNSFYLMIASAGASAFGFFFWVLVARRFDAETVGLATTLLSAGSFLALLGLAGFDTIFIRFLAKSKRPNEQISTGLLLSALVTSLLSVIFCALTPRLSPQLAFMAHRPLYVLLFAAFGVLSAWNILTNAVITAYRHTSYVLLINIIFGFSRVTLPFVVHARGPMAVFGIVTLALVVNVATSFVVIMRRFGYRPTLALNRGMLREMRRYGLAVYLANTFNLLPDSALPLIVVNRLGARAAAYFYVAFTIANLLYTIAFSITQALLAEASYDEKRLLEHLRRALQYIAVLMIPAIAVLVLICPFALELFGHGYRNAAGVLRILGVSGAVVALYTMSTTAFKLLRNLRAVLLTTAANAACIIGLTLWLVTYGLNGVGWAWLAGNVVSVGVAMWFMRRQLGVAFGMLRTPRQ